MCYKISRWVSTRIASPEYAIERTKCLWITVTIINSYDFLCNHVQAARMPHPEKANHIMSRNRVVSTFGHKQKKFIRMQVIHINKQLNNSSTFLNSTISSPCRMGNGEKPLCGKKKKKEIQNPCPHQKLVQVSSNVTQNLVTVRGPKTQNPECEAWMHPVWKLDDLG